MFTSTPHPDFVQCASYMSISGLARHFGKARNVIKTWLRLTGVTAASIKPGNPNWSKPRPFAAIKTTQQGHGAQRHLQKHGPVWRCTETGRTDPKGTHYLVYGRVRTAEEMVAMAERKGWRAKAWEELGA